MKGLLQSLVLCALLPLTSCNQIERKEKIQDNGKISQLASSEDNANTDQYSGLYASEGYKDRDKGYDWITVRLIKIGRDSIGLEIRSREDLKKPTCTLDAKGAKTAEGMYKISLQYGIAELQANGKSITILPASSKDEAALSFPCSGGASIAGNYVKFE